MVFSSLFFLYLFLPVCLICYASTKKLKYRNLVLLVFSLIFYAWGEPLCVFLLIISTAVNYLLAFPVDRYRGRAGGKAAITVAIVYDLLMLGIFKYSGFIAENLNMILPFEIPVPDVKLPIGISFYTFQIISYMIDLHWEKVGLQRSFSKFLMYVSLFPQLVAGPIVRYSTIETEINKRRTTLNDLTEGISRLSIGLAKKVILSNNLSTIVAAFFESEVSELSVAGTWYAVIVYAMQIYFDFSGYSDMAIGLGRIFGFHFDENFRYPFICKDVSEFWQRWHISLGSFFRDYLLYVPIFGKRRKIGGLFLVWFCTGLWHGASWNYIIWGLYFGVFIFIEQLIGKKKMKKIPIVIRHIYNKIVIIIGFGIFYFENLPDLGNFFKNLIGLNSNSLIDEFTKLSITNNLYLLIIAVICCFPVAKLIKKIAEKSRTLLYTVSASRIVVNASLLVLSSILLVDATNNPFLYFRF
ncbi:MAG: MBOAT family O-acyltransferase [Porcipelethomonas sp.]